MTATSRLDGMMTARGRIAYERIRDEFGLVLVTGELSPAQLMGMAICAGEDGLLSASETADLATRLERVMDIIGERYAGDEPTLPGVLFNPRTFNRSGLREREAEGR